MLQCRHMCRISANTSLLPNRLHNNLYRKWKWIVEKQESNYTYMVVLLINRYQRPEVTFTHWNSIFLCFCFNRVDLFSEIFKFKLVWLKSLLRVVFLKQSVCEINYGKVQLLRTTRVGNVFRSVPQSFCPQRGKGWLPSMYHGSHDQHLGGGGDWLPSMHHRSHDWGEGICLQGGWSAFRGVGQTPPGLPRREGGWVDPPSGSEI